MKLVQPTRIKLAIWGAVALFVVVLVVAAAVLISTARLSALGDGRAQVTRFVAGAEAALNQSFLGIDVLLAGTDELLGLATSQEDWVRTPEASKLLRGAARPNLMVRFVALVDTRGNVVASSDSMTNALELPPGFLESALEQSVSTMVVSAPVVSFTSSERVVYFARYIRLANGVRLLAVAQVPVSMVSSLLLQGVDIPGLQVTLERDDGRLLLGFPFDGSRTNRVLEPAASSLPVQEGNMIFPARLSAEPSLVGIRPALYPGLWVSASYPLTQALADWRMERNIVVFAVILFAVMFIVAGYFSAAYVDKITAVREVLAQSKVDLDQALGSMVSGFLLIDAERKVVQWNRKFEEMFPWQRSSLRVGLPFLSIVEATILAQHPGLEPQELQEFSQRRLVRQSTETSMHEMKFPDGRCVEVVDRMTPSGGFVISYNDVTALRQASVEIETLAFYDPLTGLPNRRLLLDRVSQSSIAALRSGLLGALLFLDLDKFKNVNDTMGHEVGDELLRQVAHRLTTHVRDTDTVARLGGDEFVLLLPELSHDSHHAAALAQTIGDKLLLSLNQPYVLGGQTHRCGASMGATLFGRTLLAPAELLKQGDIAMYQVKGQQGNALRFFDPRMQADITHRAQLESDLRSALESAQFELFYQPQVALGGRIVGAEVLLRWHHPVRGLVSPTEFIAVAEERELIVPIGMWVLQSACAQLAAWQTHARLSQLQLSVNVSARQFRQPDFADQAAAVIREAGIRPQLLKLELTESLVLDNVDDCVDKMEVLKARGVQFSVDDFGTGHSSLAYLTRLPLDELKIDQSFVRNLGMRQTDGVIVQTIIGMARNLGLEVIAEGVETIAQRDLLDAHGCHLYQGYLFAKPSPVTVFEELVAQSATAK